MFKNKHLIIRDLTLFCLLGNLLYFVFPFQPIVWRVFLVLISIYVIIDDTQLSTTAKWILIFLFVNVVYFIIYLTQSQSDNLSRSISTMGNIFCALLPFIVFSYLGKKNVITDKYITVSSILLSISAIYYYHHYGNWLTYEYMVEDGLGITNNASTVFLFLLPMLFLIKQKWLAFVELLICIFFILDSVKRGNIFASIIPVILFIHYYFKTSKKRSIGTKIILVTSIIFAFFIIRRWLFSNDYFWIRWASTLAGYSSHRDEIFMKAWEVWSNSESIFRLLFGYGFNSIISFTKGFAAHNDWLEILVDYGLFGVSIYLFIFINLIKQFSTISEKTMKYAFFSAFIIWLFKTFYSMGFTESWLGLIMMTLGIVLGKNSIQYNNNKATTNHLNHPIQHEDSRYRSLGI